MSSNIPRARELIAAIVANYPASTSAHKQAKAALRLMTRAAPIKRTRGARIEITDAMRRRVRRLAEAGTSHHDIAVAVGLRNAGRVSEILRGKR
ncbi:hypothetical protein KQX64_06865 [Rhodopseudomonas palustris]|nr:hypothetical protein KQX64_06865 [Rhodopseudomonas palustris]